MVEQGDRHRACLRPRGRAPPRTGHGLPLARRRPLGRGDLGKLAPLLHDRMTESVWLDGGPPADFFRAGAPRPLRTVPVGRDGRRALGGGEPRLGTRAVRGRDRLFARRVPHARARSDRRRAHDVRAGELRALPPQDLQRGLRRRRRGQPTSLFDMIRAHLPAQFARRAVGVPRQRRGRRGSHRRALLPGSRDRPLLGPRGSRRHSDEGRDAQSSDGDFAVSGRGDRCGRRDPRRRRDRPRREAEGRPRAASRSRTCDPGHAASLGTGLRQAGAHRLGARDHARGADRRGRVQQRVRAAEHLRLFPHLRAVGQRGPAATSCAAITSRS